MRPITLHPSSLLVGAGVALLAIVTMSQRTVTSVETWDYAELIDRWEVTFAPEGGGIAHSVRSLFWQPTRGFPAVGGYQVSYFRESNGVMVRKPAEELGSAHETGQREAWDSFQLDTLTEADRTSIRELPFNAPVALRYVGAAGWEVFQVDPKQVTATQFMGEVRGEITDEVYHLRRRTRQ